MYQCRKFHKINRKYGMRIWSESTARENYLPISRHTSSKTEMIKSSEIQGRICNY